MALHSEDHCHSSSFFTTGNELVFQIVVTFVSISKTTKVFVFIRSEKSFKPCWNVHEVLS
jgi:hypothetical protein